MRTIGVRELKAHLSRTLSDVRAGEVFLVTDRGRVIAELRQPTSAQARDLSATDQATLRLSAAGELRVAEGSRARYGATGVSHPDGTAQAWLDWTRGER
ncbi:MAG: type II toxin-antitoxin system Phd/YefM family antitoxin [Gemmatimonadaceae bacterium]